MKVAKSLQDFLDSSAYTVGDDVYFSVRENCYGPEGLPDKALPVRGGLAGSLLSAAFNKVGLGGAVRFLKQPDLELSGYMAMTVRASLSKLKAETNSRFDFSKLMVDKSSAGVTALPDASDDQVDERLHALNIHGVALSSGDMRSPFRERYPSLRQYDPQSREVWRGYQIGPKDGWDVPVKFDVIVDPQTGNPEPISGVLEPYKFALGGSEKLTAAELGFWPGGGTKNFSAAPVVDTSAPEPAHA